MPSGKEQWGAVAEVMFLSNEVKDPAVLDASLVAPRQGPLRVGFLQAGVSDTTLSDRVISSGSQWATFCGNCVISKGVWSWSGTEI